MKNINISTNILRDEANTLDYIVTKNSVEIFNSIFNQKNKKSKSFSIVGNYGTGKSTFLLASEKNLKEITTYFTREIPNKNGYDFLKIIGESSPISKSISHKLKIDSFDHNEVIEGLEQLYLKSKKSKKDFVLIIDEFGKFLEYINKTGNSEDLYLIQLIAEWANDENKDITFIITLHQDFSEYNSNLSNLEKREWEKVKGRFRELLFNEPIEQLIFFAGQSLKQVEVSSAKTKSFKKLNQFIRTTELFTINDNNYDEQTKSILPLDWLSINVLVNSLQRYGQNERSLFSFLSDLGSNGINGNENFSIDKVFDYLVKNLSTEINNYKNPNRVQWQIAFRAFDRSELLFENQEDYKIANRLIKIICLLNIFAKSDSLLDDKILATYAELSSDTSFQAAFEIIHKLMNAGIIRFYRHSKKINFLEGTDLDIDNELVNVSKEINLDFKIDEEIEKKLNFPILPVKRSSYEKGTPRYFEFRLIEDLQNILLPTGTIDGYINLIFDENIADKKIQSISKNSGAQLFVIYKNSKNIHDSIFTIHKLEFILNKRKDDQVAKNIILKELGYYQKQLEKLIIDDLFVLNNENKWFYNGKPLKIGSKKDLNIQLSKVCDEIYSKAPMFKNELINREFISSQISVARKKLFRLMLSNSSEKNLGFETDKFPPEKAIYTTLFELEGIHRYNSELGYFELGAPTRVCENKKEINFGSIWEDSEAFLNSSISSKRNLGEFYNLLSESPYKLKKGFLDLWILSFLIIKKEDYALFHDQNGFIPYIDEDILDFIYKNPYAYSIKSYRIDGLKLNLLESYKELVQLHHESSGTKSSFLTVYGSFLKFYNSLNDYSKKTKSISAKAIAFRDAIKNAKDPEQALFSLFPHALGFNNVDFENNEEDFNTYIFHIQDSIREIRISYDQLLNRVESQIIESLECENTDFHKYKIELTERLKSIKPELLTKDNAIFFRRIVSPIDDRESWIKSVADIALGKPIDKMLDSEEILLMNNVSAYAKKLFEVSSLHEFKSEYNRRMVSLTYLNTNGEQTENKLIIDESFEHEIEAQKSEILKIIGNLNEKQRKQILFQLLNNELINN